MGRAFRDVRAGLMRVCLEDPRRFEIPKEVVVKVVDILKKIQLVCNEAQLGQNWIGQVRMVRPSRISLTRHVAKDSIRDLSAVV